MTVAKDVQELRRKNQALERRLRDTLRSVEPVRSGEFEVAPAANIAPTILPTAELRANEQLLRAIFESAGDAILLCDDGGRWLEVNGAACELFGVPPERLVGQEFAALAGPDYVRPVTWQKVVDSGPARGEIAIIRPDGTHREVEYSAVTDIAPGVHLTVMRDITERAKAAQARSLLAAIVASSEDAIISTTLDGTITSWNRGAETLLGFTAEEVMGRRLSAVIPPDRQHPTHQALGRVMAGMPVEHIETTRQRKDGSSVELSITVSPIWDANGLVVGVSRIARDLTERNKAQAALRRTEEQLRQAQKMEAVGRLAAGVAHDFNNILSVILSYAETMGSDLKLDDPFSVEVEEIRKAAVRASDLTRQLLAFSRQQVLEPKVLCLNKSIAGMEKMLRRLLGADVELTIRPTAGLWSVKADPGQVEQILMNLAVNARDAMAQGGQLTIETANVALDSEHAREHRDVQAGSYVMLTVSDTGVGMDAETQLRIFEPFFTTKDKGKGTGLGLATVFGVVKQSGGHIEVQSEPARGTTFKVYFPKVADVADAPTPQPPSVEVHRGTETILLVEDDDQVRAVARDILRRKGYVVLEAPGGAEARLICEQNKAEIHLLLTDVVLPRMSGRHLVDHLLAIRPAMRVVFMSGYAGDAIMHHGILDSGFAFIQKPLTPSSLTRKVREVLGPAEEG